MSLMEKLKSFAKKAKQELKLYRNVMKDERTPVLAKFLLWLAIGYLLSPFDLIPDFIPILGQLDDLIIVPGLIYFALKLIPSNIIEEHRNNAI